MNIEKRRLNNVDKHLIIKLLNHPQVKRHMPLSSEHVGDQEYDDFIAAKQKLWDTYGFGPWAYFVKDTFIGWGGIQPDEGTDFEIAIVLDPAHWGYGKQIYFDLIEYAFSELKLQSVTILFPPSRTRIKGILKAGFVLDGEAVFENQRFIRYRLMRTKHKI